jgi:predicted CopG family antitoxin
LTRGRLPVHAKCMAVKTITIDMEAYDLLSRSKRTGQSFSQVIKEHFSGAKKGRDLQAALREISVSDATLDAIDELVEARERNPAQAAEL